MPDSSLDRTASLEVPVFAIPREGDLGCGDVRSVFQVIDLAEALGIQSLTLLPILETVKGNDPSAPISLYALEPLLLDVSSIEIEELTPAQDLKASAEAAEHRRREQLAYTSVKKRKLDLLWTAFEAFWKDHYEEGSDRAYQFHQFCHDQDYWLSDYCLYRLLMDFEQGTESWEDWSEDYGDYRAAKRFLAGLSSTKAAGLERQLAYYAYVQWIAHQQWLAVREHADAVGVKLYTEVRCAVSPHCSEFFRSPEKYRLDFNDGRQMAVHHDFLDDLSKRLNHLAPYFHGFSLPDFRQVGSEIAEVEANKELDDLIKTLPAAHADPTSMPIRVAWESLPSLEMHSALIWPAPNGEMPRPAQGAQMSFAPFGSSSLRRLWMNDSLFRRSAANDWSINAQQFDQSTTLSLLKKLFQYPARSVQISYLDLMGLESKPGLGFLPRYNRSVTDFVNDPDWPSFLRAWRRLLTASGRHGTPQAKRAVAGKI